VTVNEQTRMTKISQQNVESFVCKFRIKIRKIKYQTVKHLIKSVCFDNLFERSILTEFNMSNFVRLIRRFAINMCIIVCLVSILAEAVPTNGTESIAATKSIIGYNAFKCGDMYCDQSKVKPRWSTR
jgi:hypothetical protein